MIDTRNGRKPAKDEIPKGHLLFLVTGPKIKDNTGAYCKEGDYAILNKKTATHYLNRGFIRVELPEDFGDDTPTGSGQAKTASGEDQGQAKP